MLYGEIIRQHLKLISEHVVADTIDYLEMKFSFQTDDWDGLEKWAHFAKKNVVYDIRLTDDCIRKEDHLNLSAGIWKVYIHGNEYRDGKVIERITTCVETLQVLPTGTLDGEPFPEMPASVTEQILARLENVEQNGGGGVAVTDMYIREKTMAVDGEAPKTTYILVLEMSDGDEITCELPETGLSVDDIITVSRTDPTDTNKAFEGHLWFNKATGGLWVYAQTIQTGGIFVPGMYSWYKVGGGSGLPEYTAADEGKVLGIVNGKPAWVTVQTAPAEEIVLSANEDGSVYISGVELAVQDDGAVLVGGASVALQDDGAVMITGGI